MNGEKVSAGREYSVELVSPILTYEKDMATLQELIRKLRKAGAFSEKLNRTGVHIHLNGADHTPRSLRNFINIIYSRNDLLYESLEIEPTRMRYCKKMDQDLVERMNRKKPTTFKQIEDIWYEGYSDSRQGTTMKAGIIFSTYIAFSTVRYVELRGLTPADCMPENTHILTLPCHELPSLNSKERQQQKPQVENSSSQ